MALLFSWSWILISPFVVVPRHAIWIETTRKQRGGQKFAELVKYLCIGRNGDLFEWKVRMVQGMLREFMLLEVSRQGQKNFRGWKVSKFLIHESAIKPLVWADKLSIPFRRSATFEFTPQLDPKPSSHLLAKSTRLFIVQARSGNKNER